MFRLLACISSTIQITLFAKYVGQTKEYSCVAPEIYFIAIFGAPKVHCITISNTYSVLVLVRSLCNSVQRVVFHKSELAIRSLIFLGHYRPLAAPRSFLRPCPEILQLFRTRDLGENGRALQSGMWGNHYIILTVFMTCMSKGYCVSSYTVN